MASLADVYRAINALRDEGIVENYAVGGGMAALFYAETTRTYDVDVFVLLPVVGLLVDLSAIYAWAKSRGYQTHMEHILIHGVPVQILSAKDGFESEAVSQARQLDYAEVQVPVIAPEYLAVLYVLAGSAKRRERVRTLAEAGTINRSRLDELLERYNLRAEWQRKGGEDVFN